ncbi:DNA cytosine methyltransferase [Herbaspirillum rhizosphaerae]|uniref:DNA cytosine methyltransferase n=1 Tax=Herbaspirillum rhizosphaerae TaxID=346179 RepID=UPI00067C4538|nr:DNA cytosine methyltransferase [Herbaspirillum rhizosphaerae]
MKKKALKIEAIDLFCGAGGLSFGLRKSGVKVLAGIDLDPECKYPFEKNNRAQFFASDVTLVKGQDIAKLFSPEADIRVLAGCAPCQPFSKYRQGEDTSVDKKWRLLYEFARLVREIKPDVVTMENVPELKGHKVFDDFVLRLRKQKYKVSFGIVNCLEYGIPQSRKRLVLLASKHGDIELIEATHSAKKFVTVKKAIGHLPPIDAGERHENDPLHVSSKLNEINLRRVRQSKPGGTWKDWDEELQLACHKKDSGKSYASIYGRMEWDSPAPTMTTLCYGIGNGRFGHPEQDRAISLREAAIFQTFPESYEFAPPDELPSTKTIGRLIGNAVPVRLGEVIGLSIKKHCVEQSA